MQKIYDQKELIHTTDWDYLIILDACRYDYFERVYRRYFPEGKLRKVISPGNWTVKWLKKVWNMHYFRDIIYLTANPYINDSPHKLPESFDGSNRFYKIEYIWKTHWNNKINTVHPREVNKVAQRYISMYPKKRFVIHYIQPHVPFIPINKKYKIHSEKFENTNYLIELTKNLLPKKIRRKIGRFLDTLFRYKYAYKFLSKFGIRPLSYYVIISSIYGKDAIKSGYLQNLELVLRYVTDLVEKIPYGKIVITSDHGELLGEDGIYGHPAWAKHPKLFEVPWLEIDKGKRKVREKFEGEEEKEEEEYSEKGEEIIKERLKALGYLE